MIFQIVKPYGIFTEILTDLGLVEELFGLFSKELEKLNLIVNQGKIVDASFVEIPKQRNNPEDNQQIKHGKGDELWKDSLNKKQQKDTDARWTKKSGESYYGYKNHIKIDGKSKLIENYCITPASIRDSQALEDLVEDTDKGQELYEDSAYVGQEEILS